MKSKLLWGAALLAAATIGFGGVADATIIGGSVTSGSGSFIKLSVPFADSTPNNTVGEDTFQNTNLYGFDEDQNISILAPLAVDVGTGPLAGDVVASHYVFFDPNASASQQGYVDFDANIYGIITSTGNLAASDFLANTGVTYLNPTLRGLEAGDTVSIDPGHANRMLVSWTASTPGDYVRVLTMRSPLADRVPEPATMALFGTGLAGLAFGARRRRKRH